MLNRFFSKQRPKTTKKVSSLFDAFLHNPHHQWIREDKYIKASIEELFDSLSEKHKRSLLTQDILFLRGNGSWALAFESIPKTKIVIIFDELNKLLRSGAPRLGQAILAHELGHLIHGHSNMVIDKLEAQVQADEFALNIGYGKELIEVLEDISDSSNHIELRVRISYLTSHLYSALAEKSDQIDH